VVNICTSRFYIKKSYVLPTQCIYVFRTDRRTTAVVSPYNINWLVGLYNRYGVGLLRGARSVLNCIYAQRPIAETQFRPKANSCEICAEWSGTLTSFPPSTVVFTCQYHFHQCSTFTFIYMLLLSEGQTGAAWKPLKAMLFRKSEIIG
jgi:hypothetical protein